MGVGSSSAAAREEKKAKANEQGEESLVLQVAYEGPVGGILQYLGISNTPGVILSGHLQPELAQTLLHSIERKDGEEEEDGEGDIVLVLSNREHDLSEFCVKMKDPVTCGEYYRPFFFDRNVEYGPDHRYWESLCHAAKYQSLLSSSSSSVRERNEEQKDEGKHTVSESPLFLRTSSARYATIETLVPPATLAICAFVDALREVNSEFLEELKQCLLSALLRNCNYKPNKEQEQNDEDKDVQQKEGEDKVTHKEGEREGRERAKQLKEDEEALVERLIEGIWRNVAIQYHYGKPSHIADCTMHVDHVHSALHMGVTLHGERTVAFAIEEDAEETFQPVQLLELKMKEGTTYLTCPAAIMHAAATKKSLSKSQRSVAVQLRTLFSLEDAKLWEVKARKQVLLGTVLRVLSEESKKEKIRMPSFEEWNACREKRLDELEKMKTKKEADTIVFRNWFCVDENN
ncbi:hypothetical protein QOT17_004306 [Balamuthia mandrillaris]